jgi:hypothetical protein
MATLDLTPAAYWQRFESDAPIATVVDAIQWVARVADWVRDRTNASLPMVYRGQTDFRWGLRSSLARTLVPRITEPQFAAAEREILVNLRRWQLQLHPAGGLLPALPLLSTLQHLGGKTRLIDVTHSAVVALWFAVEPDDVQEQDGRLFAMTYDTDLSTLAENVGWESQVDPFWWEWLHQSSWPRDIMIWTPPPLERRMARQLSAFVIGRMASSELRLRSLPNQDFIGIDSWRQVTSVSNAHIGWLKEAARLPQQLRFSLRPASGQTGRPQFETNLIVTSDCQRAPCIRIFPASLGTPECSHVIRTTEPARRQNLPYLANPRAFPDRWSFRAARKMHP